MSTKEENPNKKLTMEEVHAMIETELPHLANGLCDDRSWVWWAGPKPEEADRSKLISIGFAFTGREHELPNGDTAHWYHACGGFVKRTGRGNDKESRKMNRKGDGNTRTQPAGNRRVSPSFSNSDDDGMSSLMRLANTLS